MVVEPVAIVSPAGAIGVFLLGIGFVTGTVGLLLLRRVVNPRHARGDDESRLRILAVHTVAAALAFVAWLATQQYSAPSESIVAPPFVAVILTLALSTLALQPFAPGLSRREAWVLSLSSSLPVLLNAAFLRLPLPPPPEPGRQGLLIGYPDLDGLNRLGYGIVCAIVVLGSAGWGLGIGASVTWWRRVSR